MPLTTQPVAITPAAFAGAAPNNPLPIPQVYQAASNLCWAACLQMVLNFHGSGAQQGDVANREFNQTICNARPEDPSCDRPLLIQNIAAAYGAWNLNAQLISYATAFEYLESEILAGRPVEVGFEWSGEGEHVALVIGTGTDVYGPVVYVNDPFYGPGQVYFVNLQRAYNLGSWQWTWGSIG